MNRNKQLDYYGNPDVYFGGNNFRRRSSYRHPICYPVSEPIATETITNNRINGVIVTRDGNKTPVTEKTMTSHAVLKKNIRNKYLPTRKKVLLDPPRTKRRDPTEEEVTQGKQMNMLAQLAAAISSATPAQKIPIIVNVIRQNMANPLPVVQQIHNIIRNDPGIVPVEALPVDAPAEKTLVSWIKRAPRAIADLLKKGKVNILDPLSRAMVKAAGKIKIVDGNVVLGGFSIPLSRLADMGLDGLGALTGVNMPQGARDLGKLLLDQVNVGSIEEKKQEEIELLEEAKHDDDTTGFIQRIDPVAPEVSRIVDPGPSRPAPKRPEVKEEDPGIGIFAPNDPRLVKWQDEMAAMDDDIADLKADLDKSLESLKRVVIMKSEADRAVRERGQDPKTARMPVRIAREKRVLEDVVNKADDTTTMSDKKIAEYKKEIGKADTPTKLKLIADILNQELEEMYPKIRRESKQEKRRREEREREREQDMELDREQRELDALDATRREADRKKRRGKIESGRSHGSVRVLP